MHPELPRAVVLVALLQFEPLAAARECTAATPSLCGPMDTVADKPKPTAAPSTEPIGGRSDDVLHVMEVTDPHGVTIALLIFARDLADPIPYGTALHFF